MQSNKNDTNEHAPITEAELVELEGLAAKATPGPWEADGRNLYAESYKGAQNRDGCVAVMVAPMDNDGHRPYHNAELIAAAVNNLPRLIAEVRRLREEMPTAIYRMAPGERKEIIVGEHYTIYIKQTPPPPPPEMDEADKLEAAILARWANEAI